MSICLLASRSCEFAGETDQMESLSKGTWGTYTFTFILESSFKLMNEETMVNSAVDGMGSC